MKELRTRWRYEREEERKKIKTHTCLDLAELVRATPEDGLLLASTASSSPSMPPNPGHWSPSGGGVDLREDLVCGVYILGGIEDALDWLLGSAASAKTCPPTSVSSTSGKKENTEKQISEYFC